MCLHSIHPIMDFSHEQTHTILDWLNSSVEGIRALLRENKTVQINEALPLIQTAISELQKRNVK